MDIIFGEKSSVNAADFFSSKRFDLFVSHLRKAYDIILVDTPPVLVVSDARLIGKLADAVIYVVQWDQTTRVQVQAGLRILETSNIKVAGLSLSNVNFRKAYRYGGESAYLYSNYGKKYYD